MLKEIILHCPEEFRECKTTFEHLVKMQHYSMPTRMIDITQNPLVALYFACLDHPNDKNDGEVIILEIPKGEVKYYDSDTVSVIANLSRRPVSLDISKYFDNSIENFNSEQDIQFLLHEIRQEKPYFKSEIVAEHLNKVICVKPKLDNPRIIKQDGLFLLFGMNMRKRSCAKLPKSFVYKNADPIIISSEKKNHILSQLAKFSISNKKLFPEITSVAHDIKEQYKIESERVKILFHGKEIGFLPNEYS